VTPCIHADAGRNAIAYNRFEKSVERGISEWYFNGTPFTQLHESKVNHKATIVGWDDNLRVWLIKNSWVQTSGDRGFMKFRYQTDYIGFGTSRVAWLLSEVEELLNVRIAQREASIDH
jgi:C1A family cysteine protease